MTTNDNAAKFYAAADYNGPITVRIIADTAGEARAWFLSRDENFGDDCRTDAEDDLNICRDGMNFGEFSAVMNRKGYEIADGDLCGDYSWILWVRNT